MIYGLIHVRLREKIPRDQLTSFADLLDKLSTKSLITAPILKQVNENEPFTIKTDASSYAIGEFLVQGERADEHPIAYASGLLTDVEKTIQLPNEKH